MLLRGRTSAPFEPFELPLPDRGAGEEPWCAAFVDGDLAADAATTVVAGIRHLEDGRAVVAGRGGAVPRAFRVMVLGGSSP